MKKRIERFRILLVAQALLTGMCMASSQINAQSSNTIVVNAGQVKAEIRPEMYGIFFEDINFGADGGLYAKLVKNGSFEFYNPLMACTEVKDGEGKGKLFFVNVGSKSPYNTRYAHVTVDAANGYFGLSNEGYRGMGVKQGLNYYFSLFARNGDGKDAKGKGRSKWLIEEFNWKDGWPAVLLQQ